MTTIQENDATPVPTDQQVASSSFGFLSTDEAAALLIENVQDYAIFLTDLTGCIVSWNPGVERILGYSQAEFLGLVSSVIFTPEDIAQGAPEQELSTARSRCSAVDERWHVRKDGSRFWGSGFMTFLQDEAGQPRGFAKIMRDLTDKKWLEEERGRLLAMHAAARQQAEEAQHAAEENNLFKDRFISVVSHEMRTPLTSIRAWLSLLNTEALPEAETRTALDTMQRGTDTLVHLINDLLDTERIRTGKMQINLEPFNILHVVANAIQAIHHKAEAKSISVGIKNLSTNTIVLGESARMEQIIVNLLSNAVKFTPNGGHVEVCVNLDGKEVGLTVTDTGKGIAPEFLPKVFDQFCQAEQSHSRSHGGLGLGLYIVRELVELHGGTIQAESEGDNKGATFRLLLPVAPPQEN
jgi:PAS domain S-box-containing protein